RPGDVGEHLPLRDLRPRPRGHQAGGERVDAARGKGRHAMSRVSRRHFIASAAAGGGLLLAWRFEGWPCARAAADADPASDFAPNGFVRIGRDGRVTVVMNQVEMGQGTYTSMSMLLAEELEVGLDQVHLEHAPADNRLYANPVFGEQMTGASTSVRAFYQPLR